MEDDTKPKINDEAVEPETSDPLLESQKQRDEYLAGWQRAKADFLNYKKEEAERIKQMVRYANEDVMYDLIVVIDNFDLAVANLEKQGSTDKGVQMIRSQMLDFLKRHGLERMSVALGEPPDPLVTEAIATVESDLPEGVVVEEVLPGYKFYEKILRPAQVKVSKGQNK